MPEGLRWTNIGTLDELSDIRLTSEEIEAWSIPDPPARVTWAGAIYYDTLVEFLDFLRFVGHLARYDDMDRVKREELWLAVTDQVDTNEWPARRQSAADSDRSQRELGGWGPMLIEMSLARVVNNFLSYASDLLAEAFLARPDLLRERESVESAGVDEDALRTELEDITERRVRKLTSKGFEALARYLAKVNLPMLLEEPEERRAILAIRQRNLVVHSRGLVDRRWLSQFGESSEALGTAVKLDRDADLGGALRIYNRLVNRLDAAAIDRYGLDTVPRRRLSDSLGDVPRRPSQLQGRGLLADRSAVRQPREQRNPATTDP